MFWIPRLCWHNYTFLPQYQALRPDASQFVLINKILLEQSHIYLLPIFYGCFYIKMSELSSYDRDGMACKA